MRARKDRILHGRQMARRAVRRAVKRSALFSVWAWLGLNHTVRLANRVSDALDEQ